MMKKNPLIVLCLNLKSLLRNKFINVTVLGKSVVESKKMTFVPRKFVKLSDKLRKKVGPEIRQTTLFGFFEKKCRQKSNRLVQTKISEFFGPKDMTGIEKRVTKKWKVTQYSQMSLDDYIWDASILSIKKF